MTTCRSWTHRITVMTAVEKSGRADTTALVTLSGKEISGLETTTLGFSSQGETVGMGLILSCDQEYLNTEFTQVNR